MKAGREREGQWGCCDEGVESEAFAVSCDDQIEIKQNASKFSLSFPPPFSLSPFPSLSLQFLFLAAGPLNQMIAQMIPFVLAIAVYHEGESSCLILSRHSCVFFFCFFFVLFFCF